MERAFVMGLTFGLSLLACSADMVGHKVFHGWFVGWHAKASLCIFIDHWMLTVAMGS